MFLFIWVNYLNVSLMDFVFLEPSFSSFQLTTFFKTSHTHPSSYIQWGKSNCKETEIFFSSKESYAIDTEILKGRFDQAVTIPGTQQYHAFISTQDRKHLMKKFLSSEKYDIFPKCQKKEPQKRPAKLSPKAKKIAKKHNPAK